jgi:hypothetical protein
MGIAEPLADGTKSSPQAGPELLTRRFPGIIDRTA